MFVIFRADASPVIGGGHLMRCLTLADFISAQGGTCQFICAQITPSLCARIERQGHALTLIPATSPLSNERPPWGIRPRDTVSQHQDALASAAAMLAGSPDWLVVDHYGLDAEWEIAAKAATGHPALLAIDDLANRRHACEVILDQTFGREPHDYTSHLPRSSRVLTGAGFALLRPEFAALRPQALERRSGQEEPRRLLISLGGTDLGGITARVLEEVIATDHALEIDVVINTGADSLVQVRKMAGERRNIRVHIDVSDMAPLMAQADLAIGAAGTTSWERCCLGLPTLAIVLAANQEFIAAQLQRVGAHRVAPSPAGPAFRAAFADFLASRAGLAEMSRVAAAITDGQGTGRVYDVLVTHETKRCA